MCKTFQPGWRFRLLRSLVAVPAILAILTVGSLAQQTSADPALPHRIHLILKDGSYQIVTSYHIEGVNVLYLSAERGGAQEIIPLKLVDLDATHAWEQRHIPGSQQEATTGKSQIDPELLKEEADRAAFTPEIAPDLSLPEQDSVLALDTFQAVPELIPLAQTAGELNHNTAHNVIKTSINPHSSAHGIVEIKGFRSVVQLHVADPVLYVRIGDDAPPGSGAALTVDTQGTSGNAPSASAGGSPNSRYVIVRADVRSDARILESFPLAEVDASRSPAGITRTTSELLPGGHWLKVVPAEPLIFGEYALMEIVSDHDVNAGVWDFGVHPTAAENRDAIKPQPKRPFRLDHRPRD